MNLVPADTLDLVSVFLGGRAGGAKILLETSRGSLRSGAQVLPCARGLELILLAAGLARVSHLYSGCEQHGGVGCGQVGPDDTAWGHLGLEFGGCEGVLAAEPQFSRPGP